MYFITNTVYVKSFREKEKNMKKLVSLLVAMLLVTSLALVGCGDKQEGAPADDKENQTSEETNNESTEGEGEKENTESTGGAAGPAIDKDTVVIATFSETPSLSSYEHNAVAGEYLNQLTFSGLFKLNKELNPVPNLVEEYSVAKDENGEETIWTMKIYEGIKFHDGSTMTADDVVASLENAKKSPDVQLYANAVKTVKKVDELTVEITTDGPSANLLYNLAHHGQMIVPKALLESGHDFNQNPVGSGPYKFVEWKRGEQIEFTAFEDYFNKEDAPKIKNVIWRTIPEGNSRTIALEAGEIDYIIELDSATLQNIESNDAVSIIKVPGISHNWLTVNNEVKPFDDKRVRKAISKAINRDDVITVALNGQGVPAEGQTPMGMLGENPEGFDGYDLEGAKALMKEWGGDPSTIKLEVICSNDTKRRAAEIIQANLQELGIEMSIVSMDLSTYLSETAAGNFTGFIGGYSSNEMMSFLMGVYHSKNINSSNKTRTNNPDLDALIEKSTKTIDQAEREKVLKEATALLNEECYQMPLYQDNNLSAHKADLQNTFIGPSGSFYVQEWSWK